MPSEFIRLLLPIGWFSFLALQDGQSMLPLVGVNILNIIYPPETLLYLDILAGEPG